ncbi:MAG: ribbon-helix-helix protein, CopG family [Acidimicrobiales bacterium]
MQVHLEEDLDRAAAAEAARRGVSKAALIRASLRKELKPRSADPEEAWADMTGWLGDGGVRHVDDVAYGPRGARKRRA